MNCIVQIRSSQECSEKAGTCEGLSIGGITSRDWNLTGACIGFKLKRGSKRNHSNKDKSQHGSRNGKEGIIIRMISKEQVTGIWTKVQKIGEGRCKNNTKA